MFKITHIVHKWSNLCTYPCHGGLGIECVSISSNDMLQLGVQLLSYMELLQDSVGKIVKITVTGTNIAQTNTLGTRMEQSTCNCVQ